jgi:hypothetical protein
MVLVSARTEGAQAPGPLIPSEVLAGLGFRRFGSPTLISVRGTDAATERREG